jgi:hypothetical protein
MIRRRMIARFAKTFHLLVGLGLLVCMVCPDIEILCHSTDCIFLSGHDMETSVALLLIVLELTIASIKLAVAFLPRLLARLVSLERNSFLFLDSVFAFVPPAASPPLALRI